MRLSCFCSLSHCTRPAVGVVTRLASDHVALLVHGAFNASIRTPQDHHSSAASGFAIGERVGFVVQSITVADGLLSMLGNAAPAPGRQEEPSALPEASKEQNSERRKKNVVGGGAKRAKTS